MRADPATERYGRVSAAVEPRVLALTFFLSLLGFLGGTLFLDRFHCFLLVSRALLVL